MDLATASVQLDPTLNLRIREVEENRAGDSVCTYGYPQTETRSNDTSSRDFVLYPRFLRSYITRRFDFDHPSGGTTPVYELGMPAPEGISGSPLFPVGSMNIIGVLFHNHMVRTSGNDMEPGISYAFAHTMSSLNLLAGRATRGEKLAVALGNDARIIQPRWKV